MATTKGINIEFEIREFIYKRHKCLIRKNPYLDLIYGFIDGEFYYTGSDRTPAGDTMDPDFHEALVIAILKKYVDSIYDQYIAELKRKQKAAYYFRRRMKDGK